MIRIPTAFMYKRKTKHKNENFKIIYWTTSYNDFVVQL